MTSVAPIVQDQAFAAGAVAAQDRVSAAALDSQLAAIKNKINEALRQLAVLIGDDNTLEDGVVRSVNLHDEIIAALANLDFLESVEVATTGNIALSGLLTIDGHTVSSGDRVLVRAQSSSTENGIYVAAAGAWARASDAADATALEAETAVYVENGTVHGLATFKLAADATMGLAHTWRRIGGAASGGRTISRGGTGGSSPAAWPTYYRRRARAVAVANTNILAPGASLDGVTLADGDRVLLTAQTTGSQNGLWTWRGAAQLLERTTDYPNASADHAFQDLIVEIAEGTAQAGSRWRLSTAGAITIDSTVTAWAVASIDMAAPGHTGILAQARGGTGAATLAAASFLAGGAATARTLAARFADCINVKDHGAIGDGVADDASAINAAIVLAATSTKAVLLPPGTYKVGTTIALSSGVAMFGHNRETTIIRKAFNGDLLTLAGSASLRDLYLDGVGATYTGRGVVVAATSGGQSVIDCTIQDSEGYAVEFANNFGGSRSFFINCTLVRYNGSGAGRYAVKIPATQTLTAVPRAFIGIQTLGYKFIDIGGCNDLFIAQSFVGELLFNTESRGVLIVGSRIGVNETAMNITGYGICLSGNAIAPAVTILANANPVGMAGNYCNGTITDLSAKTNLIDIPLTSYTPTWTGSAATPVLGNGNLRGCYSRKGGAITVNVELTIGSTTNLSACGTMRFALPTTPLLDNGGSNPQVQIGHGYTRQDATATFEFVEPLAVTGVAYVVLQRAGAGGPQVTHLAPFAWTTNDIIRFTLTYNV
ncbi:MAG TPA: glycosyl hydrolase family 28-related protein [Planctomycetota bacterium]|nr:glycosyl hydrolase family 28-related protein [Planctomycetota bacterium]